MLAAKRVNQKSNHRGRTGSAAVKFARYTLAAQGLPVQILGADMTPLGKPCCGRSPTYKEWEEWHGCELRASLPQQKKGGLAADVSSGLIFLKKNKNKNKKVPFYLRGQPRG